MFRGFEPFYQIDSKVLILGSFPSVKSREQGFYYGNKQNRFWGMLSKVFGESITQDIEDKKTFLKRYKIALYDVVIESDLQGSADSSLERSIIKKADLSFLLPPFTQVNKIICNGKTAFKMLSSYFTTTVPVLCMPSTSSANPRYDYKQWEKELNFLKN